MNVVEFTSEVSGEGEADSQHPPLQDSVDVGLREGATRPKTWERWVVHLRQEELHTWTGSTHLHHHHLLHHYHHHHCKPTRDCVCVCTCVLQLSASAVCTETVWGNHWEKRPETAKWLKGFWEPETHTNMQFYADMWVPLQWLHFNVL